MLKLKELREQHGHTQKYLADYLRADVRTYIKYEKGLVRLRAIRLVQLADLYHVSTDYILGRTDNPSAPHA